MIGAARWIDDWSPRERALAFDLGDVAARIAETRLQVRELLALEVPW